MDMLPQELKVEILRRVGVKGFRYLAPFISGSKGTCDAVFSPVVLYAVDLGEFFADTSMLKEGGTYRPFFQKCVVAGNRTAIHLEGLRILCQEGPFDHAFAMVSPLSATNPAFAIFVTGVFRICSGHFQTGRETLQQIWNHVSGLDEAVVVADTIIDQIVRMGAANRGLYDKTFTYPIEEAPHCTYIHCEADNVCQACYAFWYCLIVHSIC